jgi:gamma-glutamyl:cysteine ligase YbdK (ATP-grasp superfamily)
MTAGYHLFERFGVELEYMIVERESLAVLPVADQVLYAVAEEHWQQAASGTQRSGRSPCRPATGSPEAAGGTQQAVSGTRGASYPSDVDLEELSWSNELVLHVIELKTNGPARSLNSLADYFQRDVRRINELAGPLGGRLMPSAMHPWMDPRTETRLWPHDFSPIYQTLDRIFDCQGHGWSNLQCVHFNLPFADDEEFGRLHAAIRLLLPVLPALAASSPLADGHPTGLADTRLEVYRSNARRIPSVSGQVIPEPVFSQQQYEEEILDQIYRDLAPHDPEGILRFEWVNARGAIARFERNTIEIRVIDIQECPQADLAILRLVVAVLRALVDERWGTFREQSEWLVAPLEHIFLAAIRDADRAIITDPGYLAAFGLEGVKRCTAAELWTHLFETLFNPTERRSPALAPMDVILREGCLSRRIARRLNGEPSRQRLTDLYRELCECLSQGRMFRA